MNDAPLMVMVMIVMMMMMMMMMLLLLLLLLLLLWLLAVVAAAGGGKLIILQVCVAQCCRNLVQNVRQSYSSGGYRIVLPHPTLWHSPSNGNDMIFPFQRWDTDLFPGGYLLAAVA